jgi:negative regulator of replication initiation
MEALMDRMRTIEIDPVLSRYIDATKKGAETSNETIRRLLRIDEVPLSVPGSERPMQEQSAPRKASRS